MKIFHLYIKSHCESPDYEDEVEAEDLKEASEKFWRKMPLGYTTDEGVDLEGRESWSPEDLISYIGEIYEQGNCQKCGEPLNNGEGELCFKCKVEKANV